MRNNDLIKHYCILCSCCGESSCRGDDAEIILLEFSVKTLASCLNRLNFNAKCLQNLLVLICIGTKVGPQGHLLSERLHESKHNVANVEKCLFSDIASGCLHLFALYTRHTWAQGFVYCEKPDWPSYCCYMTPWYSSSWQRGSLKLCTTSILHSSSKQVWSFECLYSNKIK